jgi:hypothetical protein
MGKLRRSDGAQPICRPPAAKSFAWIRRRSRWSETRSGSSRAVPDHPGGHGQVARDNRGWASDQVPFAARWGGRFAPGASHPRSPLPRSTRGAVPQVSAVGNGSLSRGREAHPDLGGRSVPRWRCPIRGRGGLPGADARSSLSQATWPCPPGHPIPHVKNRFESLPSENVDRSMQNCAGGGSGSSSTGARRSPLYAFIASVAARERVKRGPDLHPHRSVSRPQVGDSRLGLPRDSLSRDAGIHHAT